MSERLTAIVAVAWITAFLTMMVYGLLGCLGHNGCWSTFGALAIGVFISGYGVLVPLIIFDSHNRSADLGER